MRKTQCGRGNGAGGGNSGAHKFCEEHVPQWRHGKSQSHEGVTHRMTARTAVTARSRGKFASVGSAHLQLLCSATCGWDPDVTSMTTAMFPLYRFLLSHLSVDMKLANAGTLINTVGLRYRPAKIPGNSPEAQSESSINPSSPERRLCMQGCLP